MRFYIILKLYPTQSSVLRLLKANLNKGLSRYLLVKERIHASYRLREGIVSYP